METPLAGANDTQEQKEELRREDGRLVERFRELGDRTAFQQIIEKYENRIYRFGFRMCGHREDAEDVVQDTFINAFRYLKDFRGEASLLSWLLRIASSACIKKRRLRKNQPRQLLEFEETGETGSAGIADPAAVRHPTPHEALSRAEAQELLRRALEKIPASYRAVLVLREMEGLSGKETSEALGISEGAVKVRLHRARAMVYQAFESMINAEQQEEA